MAHSSIRLKVRRRKVANLAAISRKKSVKNNTIPPVDKNNLIEKEVKWGKITVVKGKADYTIPKEGYPQPKCLKHSHKNKKGEKIKSNFEVFENKYNAYKKLIKLGVNSAWYREQLVRHKMDKWDRKNPAPINTESNQKDLFEEEFMIPYRAKRDMALERIRDFVNAIYDKLPLTGRFKSSEDKFVEEPVAKIKDINAEGHDINNLDPNKSKIIKIAQNKTNEVKAKRTNLVCTNLKDHKRNHGRIILPKAAQQIG